MTYSKTQIRTALSKAREAGKSCDGLSVGLRDTELQLETWGFLPLPGDQDTDKRVRDWYIAQGLASPLDGEQRREVVEPEPVAVAAPSDAALAAAEAALGAATAALALARSMSITPPERRHSRVGQT